MNKLTRFVADYVGYVLKGGPKFYTWMGALSLTSWPCCTGSTCRTPKA